MHLEKTPGCDIYFLFLCILIVTDLCDPQVIVTVIVYGSEWETPVH